MSTETQQKLKEYLRLNVELGVLRTQQRDLKKQADTLEKDIKRYMTENEMDSISLQEGEIVLYNKKINQTFKKESIVEKLTEELKDTEKAEELTNCILNNKTFVMEEKVKAVIKKKKK
jgi:hypothetical protein